MRRKKYPGLAAAYQKRYREKHPEKQAETYRKYLAKYPGRKAANQKKAIEAHPERSAEYQRRYEERHPGIRAEAQKRYRAAHPDRVRAARIAGKDRDQAWRDANREHLNAWNKAWAAKNKDKVREMRNRYQTENAVKIKEKNKKRYRDDKEKYLAVKKKWRQDNPEKCKELARSWKEKNRERYLARCSFYSAERKALERQATPLWASKFFLKEIYHLAQLRTRYLGVPHEVDHIIPLKGKNVCGLHVEHNLRVIPWIENIKKSNKLLEYI